MEHVIAELESLGEEAVRLRLTQGFYKEPSKIALVTDWLGRKRSEHEAAQSARNDAAYAEQASLASRAAIAAERAATAAEAQARFAQRANMIAKAALVIAIVSMMVALMK